MPQDVLEISATLKPGKILPGTALWLQDIAESLALIGGWLLLIHPELYMAGRQVFRNLAANPTLVQEGVAVLEILRLWTTPFSAYNIISNRETPYHRDNHSRAEWFDVLTTVGMYAGARLVLANLNQLEFQYDSGTVIALCGKLLRHGVDEVRGDRLCIAQYMRDNVHARVGVPAPGWVSVEELSQYLEQMYCDN